MMIRIKVLVSTFVLALAFVGLLWATLREGTEYYKHVEEVMVSPQWWEGKPLQLHGFVVPRSILRRLDTLEYKFQVESEGIVADVLYTGIVPDTFKDGAEVVLKGRLTNQIFNVSPNGVMTKCPSKY